MRGRIKFMVAKFDIPPKEILENLNKQKMTSKQMAKVLGCCSAIINKWFKHYKIKRESTRFENLFGQRFGSWIVIERMPNNSKFNTMWKCKCDCGNTGVVYAGDLKRGNHNSCGKCTDHFLINHDWWRNIKKCAKCRDIPLKVTQKDIYDILERQNGKCRLCGLHLTLPYSIGDMKHKYIASLDRIDSNGIYERKNIQIIYKTLNWMKSDFSNLEFIVLCNLVSNMNKHIDETSDFLSMVQHIDINYLHIYKYSPASKKYGFNITVNELKELWIKQKGKCLFTEKDLMIPNHYKDLKKEICTASINRINHKIGYEPNNIQFVYKPINQIKWKLSNSQFINMCKKISNYQTELENLCLEEHY